MKLSRIAQAIGCTVPAGAEGIEITRVAAPEEADEHAMVFVAGPAFEQAARASRAAAAIARPGTDCGDKVLLASADPYLAYARAALLFEDRSPLFDTPVDPSAVVHRDATVDPSAFVGPGSVIGRGCRVGARTVIGARCVVENNARIGCDCRIDSGAVIRRDVRIGDRVIIQSGAVIGSEGFGNAMGTDGWVRIPCFGTVVIEDDAEIGANATIDRGNFAATRIRRGARLDNMVHVAHNVEIGEHTAIAAQTGISGSTRLGNRVLVGGQAGFVGHIEIGDGAFVGAQAGVSKSVAAGAKVTGYPARDLMTMRRIDAALSRLPELVKELRELHRRLERLERGAA